MTTLEIGQRVTLTGESWLGDFVGYIVKFGEMQDRGYPAPHEPVPAVLVREAGARHGRERWFARRNVTPTTPKGYYEGDPHPAMDPRRELAELGRKHGWAVLEGNRTQLFTRPDHVHTLIVTWGYIPHLPCTERWCDFVGAELLIPSHDERFRDGMCGTTEYDGARRWLADEPVSTEWTPQPTEETGETA